MSMPKLPEVNLSMEEALRMIVASIAMEELSLSHILNAEGEKLQYVLGTLGKGRAEHATIPEVIAVNRSIRELLDTVLQSQIILKNKLDTALEALRERYPPPCPPPCPDPPKPPCPPPRPPCPPPRPPCPPVTTGFGGSPRFFNGCR